MEMVVEDKSSIPLCSGSEDIRHQIPSGKFEYKYKEQIEALLGLGEYLPFHTMHRSPEYMFRLSVNKYVHKNQKGLRILIDRLENYIIMWNECIISHKNQNGTYCYNKDFRALMLGSFTNIRTGLSELRSYIEQDFEDFNKNLEFAGYWNNIQEIISETFYAHLVEYPKWLGINKVTQSSRNNCSECKVMNNIGPPPLSFIGLSSCFMPYVTHLPDGTVIPEGVIVNDNTSDIHALHEHIHGYLHEKKIPDKEHIHCEWIDEGIADWAAVKILEPDIKEKSHFLEMYDFWIVLNSLENNERKFIIKLWCNEPERFRWREFVKDAINCLRKYRNEKRTKMAWFNNENCNFDLDTKNYIIE
jgi:hypothetical protein